MRWFRTDHDDEAGHLFDVDRLEELTELSPFVDDLRTAFPEPRVDDPVQRAHLIAMTEAARPDAIRSAGGATARHTSRPPTPRRSPVFKSLAAKITAIAVVAFASLGGLATAGALPGPVQHGVARVADTVGLNLPDPDEQDEQSDDQSEPNDESDDQGTSEDSNDQGDQNDQGSSSDPIEQSDHQSGTNDGSDDHGEDSNDQGDQDDQGSSSDSNEQSGDQSGPDDESNDQGTSEDNNDQGDQGDQGGE